MNRIEFINKKLIEGYPEEPDYIIISSLIYSLNPEEACSYLDLTFEQDFRVRRYILKKITRDISKSFTPIHRNLIRALISRLDEQRFSRKDSCSYCLNFLYESLPTYFKNIILNKFLESKSVSIRARGYKRLNEKWSKKYYDVIENLWNKYHDSNALKIILSHFPVNYLIENYKEITRYTQPYETSKLFIKLGTINTDLIEDLRKIDEISYCYVLTKFDKILTVFEAKTILANNYNDERIGLLLWSFGQMGLWDVIVEYDINFQDSKLKEKTDNEV